MGVLEEYNQALDDFENGFISLGELNHYTINFNKYVEKMIPKIKRVEKRLGIIKMDGR